MILSTLGSSKPHQIEHTLTDSGATSGLISVHSQCLIDRLRRTILTGLDPGLQPSYALISQCLATWVRKYLNGDSMGLWEVVSSLSDRLCHTEGLKRGCEGSSRKGGDRQRNASGVM